MIEYVMQWAYFEQFESQFILESKGTSFQKPSQAFISTEMKLSSTRTEVCYIIVSTHLLAPKAHVVCIFMPNGKPVSCGDVSAISSTNSYQSTGSYCI